MTAKKKVKNRIDRALASKILKTVSHNTAFYFFTGFGQYCGEYAVGLDGLCQKLKTIDRKSIDFHFKRRDFEKWIRGTIGDVNLAKGIKNIKRSIRGEELRVKLYQIVERRLSELKKLLASKDIYMDRS